MDNFKDVGCDPCGRPNLRKQHDKQNSGNFTKVAFIINPISGGIAKNNFNDLIKKVLDKNFVIEIFLTERANHATEIAQNLLKTNISYIIAVGGDGTINEVAKVLTNTEKIMGIVPYGSGNGLARHLKIPLEIEKALSFINKKIIEINDLENSLTDNLQENSTEITIIDTCTLNGNSFFCTAGIGFDAHVSAHFAKAKARGFWNYIKSTFHIFKDFVPETYHLEMQTADNQEIKLSKVAFSLTFANAAQFGNNAFIAPQANISDGLLNVCLVKPFPKWLMPVFGTRLFLKTINKSKFYENYLVKKITITRQKADFCHLDGENYTFDEKIIVVINPQSLRILA